MIKAGVFDLGPRLDRIDRRTETVQAGLALVQSAVWAEFLAEYAKPFDWAGAISVAMRQRPTHVTALELLRVHATTSKPVDLRCSDGRVYVVKPQLQSSAERRRDLFTEHMATSLALLHGVPTPEMAMVEIPPELIARHPDALAGAETGMVLGSVYDDRLGEGGFEIRHVNANRARLASVAMLYAWTRAKGRNLIYKKASPHRVYTIDHGGPFGRGTSWDADTLLEAAFARVHDNLITACGFSHTELVTAAVPLQAIDPGQIALAVATPPEPWGVGFDEWVAVAKYLHLRRLHLLALYGPTKPVSHLIGSGQSTVIAPKTFDQAASGAARSVP